MDRLRAPDALLSASSVDVEEGLRLGVAGEVALGGKDWYRSAALISLALMGTCSLKWRRLSLEFNVSPGQSNCKPRS